MRFRLKRMYTYIYVHIGLIEGSLRRCDTLTLETRCFPATSDAKKG
jgi:hypothetical protein